MLKLLFIARVYLLEQHEYQPDFSKEYTYLFFQHLSILVYNYYSLEQSNPISVALDSFFKEVIGVIFETNAFLKSQENTLLLSDFCTFYLDLMQKRKQMEYLKNQQFLAIFQRLWEILPKLEKSKKYRNYIQSILYVQRQIESHK